MRVVVALVIIALLALTVFARPGIEIQNNAEQQSHSRELHIVIKYAKHFYAIEITGG